MSRKRLVWVMVCLHLVRKVIRYLFVTSKESLFDFIHFSIIHGSPYTYPMLKGRSCSLYSDFVPHCTGNFSEYYRVGEMLYASSPPSETREPWCLWA